MLFHSYCTSFYGSELWVIRKKVSKNFKQFGVSYHNNPKKILRVPKFYSNHFTCSALNVLTFENFLNYKCLEYLFSLKSCKSECFNLHKFYFSNHSKYILDFTELWTNKYGVDNLLDNDLCALISSIVYVQDREESSMFFGVSV